MANGNVGGMLTQKVGPLPAWAWAGIAAVGVWFFVFRGKQAAPRGTAAGTPTGQATTDYSLGYAQGIQANAPPAPGAQIPTNRTRAVLQKNAFPGFGAVPIVQDPNNPYKTIISWMDEGSPVELTGVTQSGKPSETTPPQNVWHQTTLGGWVNSASLKNLESLGGAGGPTPRKHAVGSRSANLWHDSHPLIGARVRYPHYVNVGGAVPFPQSDIEAGVPGRRGYGRGGAAPVGGHVARVHAIARQAGVHPARVLMLNPIAGSRHVRIA